jgi:hypothetical protein
MHFQTALVIPILAIGALATYTVEGSEFGLDSDLKAVPLAIGARVVNDVYTDCTEKTDIDGQIIEGEECFAHALQYMIQILSDVHDSSQFVALLSNTVSGVQSGPANVSATGLAPLTAMAVPPKAKREDNNAMKAVLGVGLAPFKSNTPISTLRTASPFAPTYTVAILPCTCTRMVLTRLRRSTKTTFLRWAAVTTSRLQDRDFGSKERRV